MVFQTPDTITVEIRCEKILDDKNLKNRNSYQFVQLQFAPCNYVVLSLFGLSISRGGGIAALSYLHRHAYASLLFDFFSAVAIFALWRTATFSTLHPLVAAVAIRVGKLMLVAEDSLPVVSRSQS